LDRRIVSLAATALREEGEEGAEGAEPEEAVEEGRGAGEVAPVPAEAAAERCHSSFDRHDRCSSSDDESSWNNSERFTFFNSTGFRAAATLRPLHTIIK
jgi:hypothetical protein